MASRSCIIKSCDIKFKKGPERPSRKIRAITETGERQEPVTAEPPPNGSEDRLCRERLSVAFTQTIKH